ncbi:MAG: hypothetical protein F6J95_017730 [Leptolyngbya sp. SIO1E4]|nr:hypothetical protein [Leptolyngbya sp. SIO1E4]
MLQSQVASLTASQLFQGVLRRVDSLAAVTVPSQIPLSTSVHQATVALVNIVQTLCAPESGWPKDRPQTPETLLPYVNEEVVEILEALHQWQPTAEADSLPQSACTPKPSPELMSEVGAALVWSIAASTPEAMGLLEGMPATIQGPSQAERRQGIRLVPVLIVSLSKAHYALDLVTQTFFDTDLALSDSSLLQLGDRPSPAAPCAWADWRETLWAQAITLVPELSQWRQGQAVEILLPGQDWTLAQGFLSLQAVTLAPSPAASAPMHDRSPPPGSGPQPDDMGMPTSRVWLAPPATVSETAADVNPKRLSPSAQFPPLETQLSFVGETWLQGAISTSLSTDIGTALIRQQQTEKNLTALTVVRQVYQTIRQGTAFANADLQQRQKPLTLTQLCAHVQWLWVRTYRALMPLMGGLAAYRLRPGGEWQAGTLVATSQFVWRHASESPWYLEGSTGQWSLEASTSSALEIIQVSAPSLLPQSVWHPTDLQSHLSSSLCQRSPVLAGLMTGIAVKLTPPNGAFSSSFFESRGHLQLKLQLQLTLTFYPLD